MTASLQLKQISSSEAGLAQRAVFDGASGRWAARGWTEYAELEGNDSETSTSFQQRLRLTTRASMPAGTFMLTWHNSWASSSTSGDVAFRVEIDDTTTVIEYEIEAVQPSADNFPLFWGRKPVVLTAGVHDIDYDFRVVTGGLTANMGLNRLLLEWIGA